jgi:hypothetical protein
MKKILPQALGFERGNGFEAFSGVKPVLGATSGADKTLSTTFRKCKPEFFSGADPRLVFGSLPEFSGSCVPSEMQYVARAYLCNQFRRRASLQQIAAMPCESMAMERGFAAARERMNFKPAALKGLETVAAEESGCSGNQ